MVFGGIYFVCGLFGWVFVCWVFNFINKWCDVDFVEVVDDVCEFLYKVNYG